MSPWRIFSLNLMGEFTCILEACFTAHQSDTKAHSCLRVVPFMDAEYLLVEFIIVQHPPSPRLTGGNDATVSCFKDDINIQMMHRPLFRFRRFVLFHYACSALFTSHIDCTLVTWNKAELWRMRLQWDSKIETILCRSRSGGLTMSALLCLTLQTRTSVMYFPIHVT